MPGLLLDTHALFWLVSDAALLNEDSLVAIGESQEAGGLLVSAITAWELAVATTKTRVADRPHLGDVSPAQWFREAVAAVEGRVASINQRISIEAASVAVHTGHKDPGDCFLIATARIRKVPIVTRDMIIRGISENEPGYLDVVVC